MAKESDIRARLIGVGSQMTSFDFYFGVYLGEMGTASHRQLK